MWFMKGDKVVSFKNVEFQLGNSICRIALLGRVGNYRKLYAFNA